MYLPDFDSWNYFATWDWSGDQWSLNKHLPGSQPCFKVSFACHVCFMAVGCYTRVCHACRFGSLGGLPAFWRHSSLCLFFCCLVLRDGRKWFLRKGCSGMPNIHSLLPFGTIPSHKAHNPMSNTHRLTTHTAKANQKGAKIVQVS